MSCQEKSFQRLPTLVTPVNYQISLTPDLTKLCFDGNESIELNVHKPTDQIVLNCKNLTIDGTSAEKSNVKSSENEKIIQIKKIQYNVDDETATIVLSEQLQPGSAFLQLQFSGKLCDKLEGFYPSRYIGPDGIQRVTAVTQFESTDARSAFPCWDEPAHKATFDITLVVPNDGKTTALSNMPVKEEKVDDLKRRVVKFHRTPIMSTYLVAFAVGEFDFIETRTKHGVLVRVYTPIGKAEQGRFALNVAARSLDYLTDYFQIPYPLSKLDLIAVSDFAAGAMENWGLVTYREVCLLVDPANTATIRKQNVSLTVAHELAHQWFGNLVTMEWWTHLWLNEGFATFMQYLCVDDLFPEFNIWTQFVSDVFLEAMELDSLDNSHPIEIPVGHPSEVDQIFDEISYSKGACVIRMLYNYIGDEMFRKGMKLYLTRFSYKNAQTEDLWDALEEASKKPIRRMMTTWTKQKGYPVVQANIDQDILKMNQEKFNANGKLSAEDSKMLWANPVQVISASSNDKLVAETLLEKRSDDLKLQSFNKDDWLKLNPSAVGFFRVNYHDQLLNNLLAGVAKQTIKPVDRLNLIDDLYAMTMAGRNHSDNLLKAINSFSNECDYTVWTVMSNILGKYNQLLYETEHYEKFLKFGQRLITHKAYPSIGWEPKSNESHLDTLLRSLLINRLVSLEYPEVMEKCRKAFEDHVAKRQLIPADLRSAVYQAMARQCDDTIWETFMKLYHEADLQEEKNRIASSLGAVKKPELIDRVLKFAISDEVRSQDTVFVVASVARNPVAHKAAWEFFKQHHELFKKRYAHGFLGNRLIKCLTEDFKTKEMADEVEQFFKTHDFQCWERSIQQSIETIRLNAQLLERDMEKLAKYFTEYQ